MCKIKRNPDRSLNKNKNRLVAKGYSQRLGIDYEETCSPGVRMDSVRTILAIAAREDFEHMQFDVKTAFLYGELKEYLWINQPEGSEKNLEQACYLTKSIYGLKQASRAWNGCFLSFLRTF